LYLQHAVSNDLGATECNDLSADGQITVWDAGLLNNCLMNGAPNNFECTLPSSVVNETELVVIGDIEVYTQFSNPNAGYADIKIMNPMNEVKGFELKIAGANVVGVASLIDAQAFPTSSSFNTQTGEIAVLSATDSVIPKYTSMTPFVRIYLDNLSNSICLDSIIHVLNSDYEPVLVANQNPCIEGTSSTQELSNLEDIYLFPNPAMNLTTLIVPSLQEKSTVELFNSQGKLVHSFKIDAGQQQLSMKTEALPTGIYNVCITNSFYKTTKRLSVVR
jgi:hypothetical protein